MPIPGSLPAAAQAFSPESVRLFRFTGWRLDARRGLVELGYALEGDGVHEELHEKVDLGLPVNGLDPGRLAVLERAASLLHLVAGVSYYKTSFASEIRVDGGPIDAELADCLRHLYGDGLAECRYVNDLAGRPAPEFPTVSSSRAAGSAGLGERPLVPIGGGKDSIVTLEAVRRLGHTPLLFSVGTPLAVLDTIRASGLAGVTIGRSLDLRLFELNRSGAYNGHVPVTAINSCLAVIAALIHDTSDVVMSNERSASVGSLTWDGAEVNHQYSKGWDFERRFAAAVRHHVASDLRYFSLLRPWSDLAIARSFAPLTTYHDAFVSCNRAYLLDAERRTQRWCGDCPKCRFTTLALAPFLDRDKVVRIIGHDLLADPAQLGGFEALLGLEANKPLECVGEVEELRAAMRLISGNEQWRGTAVVAALAEDPRVRDLPASVVHSVLSPSGPHALPDPYRRFADALG